MNTTPPSVTRVDSSLSAAPGRAPIAPAKPDGNYRWKICALLFFATTINYMDRYVLGVLAPMLQVKIGWNEIQYGYIVTAFQAAYALGLLVVGNFIDRVGTRIGYTVVICIWSLAAMAHSLVRSALGFGVVRFLLGLGESGNFPAAIKTVSEWFPKRERALAVGIFNSGANVGATVAPLVVPWIAVTIGWQFAFLFTGVLSASWMIMWWSTYRRPQEHQKVTAAELAYINSEPPDAPAKVKWLTLLQHRQTWAFLVAKFLTDPIWWFFLFWLPKFLNTEYGLSITKMGLPLIVIYNAACVGSIVGGWLPARMIKMGLSLNRARKLAMLVCATAVVPIAFAARMSSLWGSVALISLAIAAHQGWSANLLTLPADVFPRKAVASVVGIGGFGGSVGGMLIATFTGFLLQTTGSYVPIFLMAAFAYLLALGIVQLLVPNVAPLEDGLA
jgi:MFS transporter, ACS family, aldohexuronate transporter